MKRNIKALVVLAVTIITSLVCRPLMAQDITEAMKNSTPEQRAQFQTSMMKNKLGLDSLQVSKVSAINLAYAKKMGPVLTGSDGRFAKLKKMKGLQEDKDNELKAVFTKDQYKQYEEMEKELKDKMIERFKNKQ